VHLSQTGFAAHLVKDNNAHTRNITPDATPYRSGLPIDTCPESDEADDCPALLERRRKYQSVVGLIGWLAQSTRPDLAPCHSFLSSYNNKPSKSHWNAALYVLHHNRLRFHVHIQRTCSSPHFHVLPSAIRYQSLFRCPSAFARSASLPFHL